MSLIVVCSSMKNVNFSMIARSASVFGADEVIGLGHGKLKERFSRTREIEIKKRSVNYLDKLKERGYRLVAIELSDDATYLTHYAFEEKTALVLGNENHGVSEAVLAKCDDLVMIPMFGEPQCFNVAVAASIAIYEYKKQHEVSMQITCRD